MNSVTLKKKFYNVLMLSALMCLIALSNCSDSNGNTGNGANSPPGAPDSEYPGNRDSTSNNIHTDTMHEK